MGNCVDDREEFADNLLKALTLGNMADGSSSSFEGIQKGLEQQSEIVELRPKLSPPEEEKAPSQAREQRRDADVTIARRETLRLQLGGAPTQRQLSFEQMRLNEQLGALRTERMELKKELLKAGAESSEDRSSRLKEIESEINTIEVRRADIGYWQSLHKTEDPDTMANTEAIAEQEIDTLRRERSALQEELDQAGTGLFSFFQRRSLESRLKVIDQQTRALLDRQRSEEALAAK